MELLYGLISALGLSVVGGLFWLMHLAGKIERMQVENDYNKLAAEAHKNGEKIFAKQRGTDSDVINRL